MSDAHLIFDEGDLNGFVDGRLDPARAAALSDSLATDRDARARIDGWKRQNDSLRTMFASTLFEPVPLRLIPTALTHSGGAARRVGEPLEPVPSRAVSPRRKRTAGLWTTTMTGAVLIAFSVGVMTSVWTDNFGLSQTPSKRSVERGTTVSAGQAFAMRAAEAHQTFLTDLTRPVELSAAEEPRLVRWIQHRLGTPLRIPDLQREGWTLIGGRVLPGQHGPAGFLVYGNGTERLGLYVSRTAAPESAETTIVDGGEGASVAYWVDGAFGFALTTSRSSEWLDRDADVLRASVETQVRDTAAAL